MELELSQSEEGSQGQLMQKEDQEKIKVGWKIYKRYFSGYFGGLSMVVLVFLIVLATTVCKIMFDLLLAYWTQADDKRSRFAFYFLVCMGLSFVTGSFFCWRAYIMLIQSVKASRKLHREMIVRVIRAPVNLYFDVTQFGQIINRFSKDLMIMETIIGFTMGMFTVLLLNIFQLIIVVAINVWWLLFIFPISFLVIVWHISRSINSIRETARLFSVTKTPVVSFLNESIPGASTIRAYGRTEEFVQTSFEQFD